MIFRNEKPLDFVAKKAGLETENRIPNPKFLSRQKKEVVN
jgi:hypothetical protein